MPEKQWSLYIIETECGKLYTGIAKDVEQRFEEHVGRGEGAKKGAKFFRSAKPKKVVFTEAGLTHSEALKLEIKVKKLTRKQKLTMIKVGAFPFS